MGQIIASKKSILILLLFSPGVFPSVNVPPQDKYLIAECLVNLVMILRAQTHSNPSGDIAHQQLHRSDIQRKCSISNRKNPHHLWQCLTSTHSRQCKSSLWECVFRPLWVSDAGSLSWLCRKASFVGRSKTERDLIGQRDINTKRCIISYYPWWVMILFINMLRNHLIAWQWIVPWKGKVYDWRQKSYDHNCVGSRRLLRCCFLS
jgi:hypothetical protein